MSWGWGWEVGGEAGGGRRIIPRILGKGAGELFKLVLGPSACPGGQKDLVPCVVKTTRMLGGWEGTGGRGRGEEEDSMPFH